MVRIRKSGAPGAAVLALLMALAAACGGDGSADGTADDAGAPGETVAPVSGDDAEVADYDLSMERLDRWFAAIQNVMALVSEDSTVAERIAVDAGDDIDAAAERLESEPRVAAALQEAGLTPREYVIANIALFQALFAHSAMQQGALQEVPEGVNEDNVEFVRENEEEIARRMQLLQTLAPGTTGG